MSVLLAVWISLFSLFVPLEKSILHLYFLYDFNRDGTDEGVGKYVPVIVRTSGQNFFVSTDENSHVGISLDQGTIEIEAYPRKTRVFFDWVCEEKIELLKPEQHLIVYCVEKFFLRIPYTEN